MARTPFIHAQPDHSFLLAMTPKDPVDQMKARGESGNAPTKRSASSRRPAGEDIDTGKEIQKTSPKIFARPLPILWKITSRKHQQSGELQ